MNIGPANTKVWNSPFSPHGSTPGGRASSKSCDSSRPANSAGSIAFAQVLGGAKHVGADDLFLQPGKLGIRQMNPVKLLEFLAKIFLQRVAVTNIRAMRVFKLRQLCDEIVFDLVFRCSHWNDSEISTW